ncbi:hypothetical protein BC628DRAFT_1310512 [Trametes gibbosa]|nr:hypothetical protein BC628DRAFT_1310512 [Trametes gibbosa]
MAKGGDRGSVSVPRHRLSLRHAAQVLIVFQKSLPAEILDAIVVRSLAANCAFTSIASFALVSRQFREIALRRYYASLHVGSPRHWVRLGSIRGMYTWVRSLEASTTSFRYKINGLSQFTYLKTLELDFSGDGLSTQSNRIAALFKNMSADLSTLKLTFLPRIDTVLLSLVSSRFSSLKILELSCTERLDKKCCWLCFEESSSCTAHSPVPDAFVTVESLSTNFCKALTPLKSLETLFLGIFLSDADVLIRHLEHCAAVLIASPRTPNFYSTPPFGPNVCSLCCTEHTNKVQERERLAKTLFRTALPSLRTIRFSSWFSSEQGALRYPDTTPG